METKNTSSSGSVLEEPEIQKLQMQAKIFKENSLNKNALNQHSISKAVVYCINKLFGTTTMVIVTLHEMDSKSALSVIKLQFERFINSDLLKPLDIYSRSFSSDREVKEIFRDYTTMTAETFKETIIQNMNSIEQCIIERASHEQELKMTLKKLSERQLQIQQCKVQEVQSSVTSSGDETSSGIVSDEEIDKQKLEAHYSYMAKIQEVSPEESSSTSQPLEQKDDSNVIPDSSNICTNDNQVDQNAAECVDERAALANLIANLTLDTEENKTILKQLKKANASLTQELEKCKTNLDETSRALGEATSSRDSCLIALQTKQTELEKYTALNDRTSDYKILQTKLNETLGLLARKDIDIQEGLKTKTYEISVVNQKHDELVKKSLLTRSQFEGQLKEKSKVISDLKVKEGKDIDTMIEHHCFVHELKIEMHDDLEYVKSLEKEVDELESEKANFSNIYDLLLEECVSKDVICSYLHSLSDLNAHTGLQCLYLHKGKSRAQMDMVYTYYLEKAKKSAQLQKDKDVNGKYCMIDPARLPNTANGCKPKPRNWKASMSSRVSNKDVHLGET
ncbi:hypothetical protein Tco_1385911 [Tanacetum coccineum]